MKKQLRIYFEGGGDGRKGKDDLRRAMDDFLKPPNGTKLNHSTKILPKVDSNKVRARCPHAERFFTTLESLITN